MTNFKIRIFIFLTFVFFTGTRVLTQTWRGPFCILLRKIWYKVETKEGKESRSGSIFDVDMSMLKFVFSATCYGLVVTYYISRGTNAPHKEERDVILKLAELCNKDHRRLFLEQSSRFCVILLQMQSADIRTFTGCANLHLEC